jgi:uncharacterized membrane protein YjgN (DUF898 family)
MIHKFCLEETIMNSKFDGTLLGLIITNIITGLIIGITLGIATPWAVCYQQSWMASHTVIDGKRMRFDGTGMQLFGNFIKWFLLCILTLGIYSFWLGIKMKQWITKHTHMAPLPEQPATVAPQSVVAPQQTNTDTATTEEVAE